MKPRMLMVHTGGVGDFICTFPTLATLASIYDIEIAGNPERVVLARDAGLARAVHDIEGTGFHSVFSEPDSRLRSFASGFDEALIWMPDHDGAIRHHLMDIGIPLVRCFEGIPPKDWERHATHWYATCADVEIALPFQVPFTPVDDGPEVILHPGSGSLTKNWPLANFEEVARSIELRGYKVVWCAGPAEAAMARRPDSLPPLPLRTLARYLAGARLFIGNDSGISHLAGLSGCPTLAIFGVTKPHVWAPAGPRVEVLQGTPWVAPEVVISASLDLLARV